MSNEKYKHITITEDMENLEEVGTKEKYWYSHKNSDWLLKLSRDGSGEHWAEKAAEQVCKLLKLPHARYEIASYKDKIGVVSKSFIEKEEENLILGNEILLNQDPSYPRVSNSDKFVKVKEHNIYRVLSALSNQNYILAPKHCEIDNMSASGVFTGYLMLDALIGNQDRHHENWGVIQELKTKTLHLAPSYDHASGFACTEQDENRERRLKTKDKNYTVEAFAQKARSGLYRNERESKTLLAVDAFIIAARKNEQSANLWIENLKSIKNDDFLSIFNNIPENIISKTAIEFAYRLVLENKRRILCQIKN